MELEYFGDKNVSNIEILLKTCKIFGESKIPRMELARFLLKALNYSFLGYIDIGESINDSVPSKYAQNSIRILYDV